MKWHRITFVAAALAVFSLVAGCGETVGTTPVGVEETTTGGNTEPLGQVTGLIAERSGMQVLLEWDVVSEAIEYEITRHNGVVEVLGTVVSTSYVDDLSDKPELLREELGYSIRAITSDGIMGKPSDTQTVPPMTFGTIIVSAFLGDEPVEGVNVFLDGEDTGERTPCTLDNVPSGERRVSFAKDRLIPWEDVLVELEADGTMEIVGAMVPDFQGRWRNVGTFEEEEWTLEAPPADYWCPDSEFLVSGPSPGFCIERDSSLSLCKNHAEECGIYGEGTVEDNGNRVEFTHCRASCQTEIYERLR